MNNLVSAPNAKTGRSGVRVFWMRLVPFLKWYAYAALGAAYALTLGARQRRHRVLLRQIADHFGHRNHPRLGLPSVAVNDATVPTTPVILTGPEKRDGNVTLLELLVLARLVRERAPRGIFEIGTFDGRTTSVLAMNAPDDAFVHTLDLPPDAPTHFALAPLERKYVDKPAPGARFQGTVAAHKIRQLYGDSAIFDFAPYRSQFVFVDGSHAYEYALSDSFRAIDMLPDGQGTIVWHDYGAWEGVTRALNQLAATDERFSEIRRVEGTTLAILDASPKGKGCRANGGRKAPT
jgi:hypothetical protein